MPATKPVSEKQLAANRRNALKSTGPRTEAGKRISRFNGQTHGLTGEGIFLDPEEQEAHDSHIADYLAILKPEGPIENDLAILIAESMYRLRRAAAVERNIYALGHPDLNPGLHDPELPREFQVALGSAHSFLENSAQIARLSLYEQRIHSAMQKNKAALNVMQAERKAAREAELQKAELLAEASYANGQSFDPAENGFGFSTEEINRSIRQKRRYAEAVAFFSRNPNAAPPLLGAKNEKPMALKAAA